MRINICFWEACCLVRGGGERCVRDDEREGGKEVFVNQVSKEKIVKNEMASGK